MLSGVFYKSILCEYVLCERGDIFRVLQLCIAFRFIGYERVGFVAHVIVYCYSKIVEKAKGQSQSGCRSHSRLNQDKFSCCFLFLIIYC